MSIVLNEYEWAEKAISQQTLGRRPTETALTVPLQRRCITVLH